MNKFIIITLLSLISFVSYSQNTDEIFVTVDVMPQYKGGNDALNNFLFSNLKYPLNSLQNQIEGTVFVSFIVEKDGKIKNPQIIKSVNSEMDAEVLRVINMMPNWIPGKQKGGNVRVKINLPVKFELPTE